MQLPDALLLRRMALRLVAQRQVIADCLGDGTAPDPGEHLLFRQLVKIPAHSRRGHVQRLSRLFNLELARRGQQFQQVIPPAIPAHQCLQLARLRLPARGARQFLPG